VICFLCIPAVELEFFVFYFGSGIYLFLKFDQLSSVSLFFCVIFHVVMDKEKQAIDWLNKFRTFILISINESAMEKIFFLLLFII